MEFTGDIGDVLGSLHARFPLSIDLPVAGSEAQPERSIFRDEAFGYSLDVSGWQMRSRGGGKGPYVLDGPDFCSRLGDYDANWNLKIGPDEARPRHVANDAQDDREAYDRAIDFARRYLGEVRAKCAGVHLFFLEGYSHLALTYWWRKSWIRRYSVVLPHPVNGESFEFAFACHFFGPFRAACRHAREFDRIVGSLRWQPSS